MIRSAAGTDAGRLAEIFVAAWRSGYRGVVADEVIDALDVGSWTAIFADLLQSTELRTTIWSSAGGEPLGFARFGADPELRRPDAGHLASLYVDPTAAGQGIGRALLEHAIGEMTTEGLTRQTLWVFAGNHRARQLYERAGFGATGERRTEPRWGAEQLQYARGADADQTATPKSRAMPVNPDA